MLKNVLVQIGEGDGSFFRLDAASDSLIRERIFQLRERGLDSRFKLTFEYKGRGYAFATPRHNDRVALKSSPSQVELLQDISQIWDFSGLNTPRYTASAAILFLRRFRDTIATKNVASGNIFSPA